MFLPSTSPSQAYGYMRIRNRRRVIRVYSRIETAKKRASALLEASVQQRVPKTLEELQEVIFSLGHPLRLVSRNLHKIRGDIHKFKERYLGRLKTEVGQCQESIKPIQQVHQKLTEGHEQCGDIGCRHYGTIGCLVWHLGNLITDIEVQLERLKEAIVKRVRELQGESREPDSNEARSPERSPRVPAPHNSAPAHASVEKGAPNLRQRPQHWQERVLTGPQPRQCPPPGLQRLDEPCLLPGQPETCNKMDLRFIVDQLDQGYIGQPQPQPQQAQSDTPKAMSVAFLLN